MSSELGQQTVDLSTVVNRTAEESFLCLKELMEKSKAAAPELSDSDQKIGLLKYLVKTQQRMLRLNAVAKWCQQAPLIQRCQELTSTLSSHDASFTQAADSLFSMQQRLHEACAPVYDVPSAVEILRSGSYQRLPECIENVGSDGSLSEEEQKKGLKKLDMLVRRQLLEVSIPKEISEVKVSKGTALLRVDGEFEVLVTLGYRGHLSMWRVLYLDLLVGQRSGLIKLEKSQRYSLGEDLERRMAAAEDPFQTLYSVLHEMCVQLVMDTVLKQVQDLCRGRWKDAVRFEVLPVTTGLRMPGLKIVYWCGDSDSSSYPSIKIDAGQDLQIKCVHSTLVIDPLTGKEAELPLDQTSIDVEKLLLKAICCNTYTRLLILQKELGKNVQIGDVAFLSCAGEADSDHKKKEFMSDVREYEGHQVLRVRAYGSSFFTLGVDIRNGRFRLQSSRNIHASPALLSECEDALDQGTMSAAEVLISLRSKSILHLFASIGRFSGLEVHENGLPAVKLPKSILNGSTVLIMGFPDWGSSYFLLMQLDKDFKPLFRLLETQPVSSGKADSLKDQNHVIRMKKIDVNQMQMDEDDMNLSLLDWGKLKCIFPSSGSMPIARCPPSGFSSVVDQVFELVKWEEGVRVAGSNSCVTTPATHTPDSGVCDGPNHDDSNHDKKLRKRTLSEMLNLIPSLEGVEANLGSCKRRKVSEVNQTQHSSSQVLMSTEMTSKTGLYCYGDLISAANKGYAPCSIYASVLLHVVRHCSLVIKHARLTSRMRARHIPYVEEVGLTSTSSKILFRNPFASSGDSWQHLCLRLGRAGYWELQEGSMVEPYIKNVK